MGLAVPGGVPASRAQAPASAAVGIGELEDARYDESRLRSLVERCHAATCSADLTAAIEGRLATIARERAQFDAARSEADYRSYLSGCVACTYRTMAGQLLQNLKPPGQPAAGGAIPPLPAGSGIPPVPGASTIPPVPASAKWHAIAFALYRVRGNARVAIGYSGARSSPDDAQAFARQACENNSDGHDCTAGTPRNQGCLYIAVGRNRRGVIEQPSDSVQGVYDKCRDAGYTCRQPIGGCLDD